MKKRGFRFVFGQKTLFLCPFLAKNVKFSLERTFIVSKSQKLTETPLFISIFSQKRQILNRAHFHCVQFQKHLILNRAHFHCVKISKTLEKPPKILFLRSFSVQNIKLSIERTYIVVKSQKRQILKRARFHCVNISKSY